MESQDNSIKSLGLISISLKKKELGPISMVNEHLVTLKMSINPVSIRTAASLRGELSLPLRRTSLISILKSSLYVIACGWLWSTKLHTMRLWQHTHTRKAKMTLLRFSCPTRSSLNRHGQNKWLPLMVANLNRVGLQWILNLESGSCVNIHIYISKAPLSPCPCQKPSHKSD